VAARIQEDDEVWRVVAVGSATSTDGFGVRHRFIQIIHVEIEMELLRHRIVGPGWGLVIHSQLEGDLGAGVAADGDPIILGLLDPPGEQGGIELG
jgi:hypothetical protein